MSSQLTVRGLPITAKAQFINIALVILMTSMANAQGIDKVKILMDLGIAPGDRVKADKLNKEGLAVYNKKNYPKAEELWIETAKTDPSWWMPFFNMGCSAAVQGETEKAFQYLEMALERDMGKALGPLKGDSDLKSLRGLAKYKDLVARYESADGDAKANLGCLNKLRNLGSKGYRNEKTRFGFNFHDNDNKFSFIFGGPGEVGATIYDIIDCRQTPLGIEIKLKSGDNESLITILMINDETIRITFGKNFNWGINEGKPDFELDFDRVQ